MKTLADLTKITKAEWLALRRRGVGASDTPTILGLTKRSVLALYAEKLGLVDDEEESEVMRWGNLMEPVIAAAYHQETGRALKNPRVLIQHDEHDFILATPDRYAETDAGRLVVEIKNVGAYKASEWEDEPPLAFQVQVQHQILVTDFEFGSLTCCLGGNRLLWTDLPRNQKFIDAMVHAIAEFWRRVELGDPPPPDGMEATKDALSALYPKDTGEIVSLPDEAEHWDTERIMAKIALDEAKDKLLLAENHLKALIGDASKAVLPTGVTYTWRTQDRAAYSVEAATYRVLRRSDTSSRKGLKA